MKHFTLLSVLLGAAALTVFMFFDGVVAAQNNQAIEKTNQQLPPFQEKNQTAQLKNHSEVGVEAPDIGGADPAMVSKYRFDTNVARSRAEQAFITAQGPGNCQATTPECYNAKAEMFEKAAELMRTEGEAADEQVQWAGNFVRDAEAALARGPNYEAMQEQLKTLIERCDNQDSDCRSLRTEMYGYMNKHQPPGINEAREVTRKAIQIAKGIKDHFARVSKEKMTQRVVALRDAASLRYSAGLLHTSQPVVEQGDPGVRPGGNRDVSLPCGTTLYPELSHCRVGAAGGN